VHVVVVGCGRVGSELAGTLEKSGHTVAVIDKNANAFRRLPAGYAGQRVVGFGFDRDNLEEAGIDRAVLEIPDESRDEILRVLGRYAPLLD